MLFPTASIDLNHSFEIVVSLSLSDAIHFGDVMAAYEAMDEGIIETVDFGFYDHIGTEFSVDSFAYATYDYSVNHEVEVKGCNRVEVKVNVDVEQYGDESATKEQMMADFIAHINEDIKPQIKGDHLTDKDHNGRPLYSVVIEDVSFEVTAL